MSQNPQPPKTKIVPKLDDVIIVNQPMVRNFSTGGGHGPEDVLVEGDEKIVTKKWQGYPPQNLNLIGKPHPPMPEVALPRLTGKAEYATRVNFPNMLHAKLLTSPHPRARVTKFETSAAEKMPGVAYILSFRNAPQNFGLTQEPEIQGAVIAIVAADTEDLAEDAIAAIDIEYEVRPFAATVQQVTAPNAPELRAGRGNLAIKTVEGGGDIEQGFREAEVIKEFTYRFSGATVIPMQPLGGVARWEGDKLTIWGMGQFVRVVYCSDAGNVINPLLAQADMHGALVESAQIATDAIPWDREFPGTRHYAVGFLSYRLPTILDVPEQTDVFINSLEPRWFFGCKGFAETTIGAVPGALANAIYNACGVRIREHPITREKIMAGLKALRAQGRTA